MPPDPTCPACGAPLPPDSPRGPCPACLMAAALERNGTNPPSGPAEVTVAFQPAGSAGSSLLANLAESLGGPPRILLREDDSDAEPVAQPASPEMPSPPDRSAHLQLFGEIARGGMGAVLKGRDTDIGRDLAIKVLLEKHRNNPDLARRFIEEAQIAGQLQHPGVVPVYELGAFADRRPYFAMKLVKGRTLAAVLSARRDPADDRMGLLGSMLQVAQTMAYAHARRVIHRDLKPSNVMLGSFGEVQVMDWGLAKVLPRGGADDDAAAGRAEPQETVIATARSGSDADLSRAGSVMGTPAYMAPEQARGEVEHIDERADVFALGAMLCEVLTGQPAFTGPNAAAIRRKAERGDLADAGARLDACGADAELIELTKHCLAPDRDDRPRDASAVVGNLSGYLASIEQRLRAAELERAAEAARAEEAQVRFMVERSRRRRTLALAASLLALVTVSGLAASSIAHERAERRTQIVLLLDRAGGALDRADTAADSDSAESEEERARLALEQVSPLVNRESNPVLVARLRTLEARAGRAGDFRALLVRLETIRGGDHDRAGSELADREYADAFRNFGLDPSAADGKALGAALAGRPESIEIAAALEDWAMTRRWQIPSVEGADLKSRYWPAVAAAIADPDAWRNRLRSVVHRYVYEAEGLRRKDDVEGLGRGEDAEALRQLADDVDSLRSQPAASLVLLSGILKGFGDPSRAAAVLRVASQWYPGDFWVNFNLGMSSWRQGRGFERPDEAIPYLRAAVSVRPRSHIARINLAVALGALGQFDDAVATCREAVRLKPDDAMAHYDLGILLDDSGDLPGAIAAYREAIRLKPGDPAAHNNLGTAQRASGGLASAIAAYREAIRLKPDYAEAHWNLGNVLRQQGQFAESLAEYRLGHEFGSKRADWRYPTAERVAEAEQLVALVDRLPAVLGGADEPADDAERLAFAQMAYDTRRYPGAARLWSEALESDPKLADDRAAQHRYNAACAAALAAAGRGEDDPKPDDAARAELRRRALNWLDAELAAWSAVLDSDDPKARAAVAPTLEHWRRDPDLVGVRDPDALAKLPEEERAQWQALWAEVDRVLDERRASP